MLDIIWDAKIPWYKIKHKAECTTRGGSEDSEDCLGEDIIKYLKKKKESAAMKMEEVIALNDDSSQVLNVFMSMPKKVKKEEVKIKKRIQKRWKMLQMV
eukprot:4586700-Ditylum_brightwellii.AAC.1